MTLEPNRYERLHNKRDDMEYIKALGTSGALTADRGTTCLQIARHTLIDAGNIIGALGDDAGAIEHIFLTHSHFDHISDIPALLDQFFETRTHTLHLYGLRPTLEALRDSLFNDNIFPDFHAIDLINGAGKSIEYHPIELYKPYQIEDVELMAFPTQHTVPSCGYVVRKGDDAIAFTSDTGPSSEVYDLINSDPTIQTLITEVSYPSTHHRLALQTGHLTPHLLQQELQQLSRPILRVLVIHLKPDLANAVEKELYDLLDRRVMVLHDGDKIPYGDQPVKASSQSIYTRYNTLLETGIALTSEQSQMRLSEVILRSARELTQSDAGTLYLLSDDEQYLYFQTIQNDSLEIDNPLSGGVSVWKPIPLYHPDGSENHTLAAAHCALSRELINIDDVYNESGSYNFNSTIDYDKRSGYRSKSMLLIPLLDYQKNLIGVLQLINKLDSNNRITTYSKDDEQVISALGSQAVISITNQKLINDLELLFESFLKSINLTLDKKSSHMRGHVQKMADLSLMLAQAIHNDQTLFPEKVYNDIEMKTIELSAMMHDIGKIATPIHIIEKSKKLETLFDRIELIELKLALLRMRNGDTHIETNVELSNEEIDEVSRFLVEANHGKEYFDEAKINRLKKIAQWHITIDGKTIPILTDDELYNLSVQKGTLTDAERKIIQHHAQVSIEFLNAIQFPKKYRRVPEIAGNHHEKINGHGYPRGLSGDAISFEARILAIADIFEALTARDRPYKLPNTLAEAMHILHTMAQAGDIDYGICKLFYEQEIYLEYAKKYLPPEMVERIEIVWD
jgi:HD-GYP domain-containing protein (c-di-GMP phosphodiesterase class II)/ribonuclease BN (tRNA processing enzyme)